MDTKQATAFDNTCDPNFFAHYAEQSESAGTRQRFRQVLEKALKLLESRRTDVSVLKVLDIGCNAGTQARMWARLGHQVTGLDVNEPLLKQQEYNLPLYSWYPGFVKRRVERLAVTTRPDLANHARYPAVHWFTIYGLSGFLGRLGIECFDRFDLIDTTGRSALKRSALWLVRHFAALRFIGHVLTPGTSVMGIKRPAP